MWTRARSFRLWLLTMVTFSLFAPPIAVAIDVVEEAKLTASDGAGFDNFSKSVSVSGDTAVIGAWRDDDQGAQSGSAYVFHFDGSAWVQEAKLTSSDGEGGDLFGKSVSISGDTVVVGAVNDLHRGIESGSTYVFRFDGTAWIEVAKLTASDRGAADRFGTSVSVSGNIVVIGASGDDDEGDASGSAYVFRYDGNGWVQEAKLTASDGAARDWFGVSVSVSGDTVVVATYSDDKGDHSGSVYVFRYDGSNWVEEAKLTASDGSEDDYFGVRASISGDVVVIGSWGDDAKGDEAGAAYVFRYDGSDWVEEAKLTASDGAALDHFSPVSVSGDTVVVGAQHDDENASSSGSVYVFRYDGRNWVEEAKLTASDGSEGDIFGNWVSVSGDTVVIGAMHDDDNGDKSGSAYVFRIAPGLVAIDVKPGNAVNSINLRTVKVISVAILGSNAFDVLDVNVATLAFGPPGTIGAAPSHEAGGHLEDVNKDGITDLLSHYRTQETGIAAGDTVACVQGEMLDGTSFRDCDSILVKKGGGGGGGCGLGFELALLLPGVMWLRQRRVRASAAAA